MAKSWLHRIRETGDFSDVTVYVEGQAFHLHMLPLVCASGYFRSLFTTSASTSSNSRYSYGQTSSDNDSSNKVKPDHVNQGKRPMVIDLSAAACGAEAFSIAADSCYLIKPAYTLGNVARVRAAADFLGIVELMESSRKFLYANVFNHWKNAAAFLQNYLRLGSSVDEYVESRCIRVITAACKRAFIDTLSLSAPINSHDLTTGGGILSEASMASRSRSLVPSHEILSTVLVKVCSLRDEMVEKIVEELVSAEVNLSLSCRQGRNAKEWLKNTIAREECRSSRVRSWIVVCLTRLLQRSTSATQDLRSRSNLPSLQLSSHYWCALLQEAASCAKEASMEVGDGSTSLSDLLKLRLVEAKSFLEERIGRGLDELDEYLQSYRLEPQVLVSLVRYFREVQASAIATPSDEPQQQEEMKASVSSSEVAAEVDSCLWNLVDEETFSERDFIFLVEAFPAQSRKSHDLVYAAIEKLVDKKQKEKEKAMAATDLPQGDGSADQEDAGCRAETEQKLWSLVDVSKLSDSWYSRAMSNPGMLKRSDVIEHVLKRQVSELEKGLAMEASLGAGTSSSSSSRSRAEASMAARFSSEKLRSIMQQLVQASLKLLEENARRAMEIAELKRRCAEAFLVS